MAGKNNKMVLTQFLTLPKAMCKNRGILAKNGGTTRAKNVPPSSVADPDHLDTDPDPG